MKYSLLLLSIVVFLPQIAAGQAAASAYNVPEAYAVYSTLLENH